MSRNKALEDLCNNLGHLDLSSLFEGMSSRTATRDGWTQVTVTTTPDALVAAPKPAPVFQSLSVATDEAIKLRLDLPGIKREDVKLTIEDYVLEARWPLASGYGSSSYGLSGCNLNTVEATMADGRLLVTIKRNTPLTKATIDIKPG